MPSISHPEEPLWTPTAEHVAQVRMTAFRNAVSRRWQVDLPDYAALYAWSVAQPELFWRSLWEGDGRWHPVLGDAGDRVLQPGVSMAAARWFPKARLNVAENLLRPRDAGHEALVFWDEHGVRQRWSFAELTTAVAQWAAAMRSLGIGVGDRVAAYLPNAPEAVIVMLAAASLGAIFTSASPDFGVSGVVDRFGQTQPRLLVTCDGYRYAGKTFDQFPKISALLEALPSLAAVVVVPYLQPPQAPLPWPHAQWSADFIAPFAATTALTYTPLPFDHPWYILYSSGTTGLPKGIVHGAGGVLLQHLKEQQLHLDIRPGDRVFFYTTCGWMMWNWLVSALATGATVLLYDGSPFAGEDQILFDLIADEAATHFGTSAKFLDAAAKKGLQPRVTHDLTPLRVVMSTGSPLVPEGFDYVYGSMKADVQLASISGGTDIVSCFALGCPVLPVWRGELQCRGLGMAVEVWNEQGQPVRGVKGELVCTRPFPVMPVSFWNDPTGAKYQAAYFERFPGVWAHGDYCELTERDGLVIYGRSDATLNPGGVRMGTAEIYRQVERIPEVLEALVVGQDWPLERPEDVRVVLFVKLQPGLILDEALMATIRCRIREQASPRHVPARIVQVADIPRTRSGKIVELAVRQVIHGQPVKNLEALANPEALAYFQQRPELSG